ncbi:MAG TPA: 2-phosphosulfolactate phosphatase [Chthonomonadales bacterium]|nr:2-phosphosulfolactate phosphatase [Chthonomonadales bacterium]
MQIRVAFLPSLARTVESSVCIVIDVLRATSVITTLFERGCPRVYLAASHDVARRAAAEQGLALCGETAGAKPEGFDFGNSPVEIANHDFSGRPAVLSTTNGTRAAMAVRRSPYIYFGAAVNVSAVAVEAWECACEHDLDIVAVCSGTNGEFTLEDAMIAGLFVERLGLNSKRETVPKLADSAIAAQRLWQGEQNLLRGWMLGAHAPFLADAGYGDDVGYCAQIDTCSAAPMVEASGTRQRCRWPVTLLTDDEVCADR